MEHLAAKGRQTDRMLDGRATGYVRDRVHRCAVDLLQDRKVAMSNTNDIKPWYRGDIAKTLMSIYFTSKQNSKANESYELGFAAAIFSVALAVGVNPESFLSPEDIQKLRARVKS